jgi:hypothetical protein
VEVVEELRRAGPLFLDHSLVVLARVLDHFQLKKIRVE